MAQYNWKKNNNKKQKQKNNNNKNTVKHSKAQTVCIILVMQYVFYIDCSLFLEP